MKKYIKNVLILISALAITFGVSLIFENVLEIKEHVTTVFVFAVFIVSLFSDGYLYGILTAFVSVILVNYAFTMPYFGFDFISPVNIVSAVIMTVVSILTSALTTKLKEWKAAKVEAENEKMRANLLRAVSHDLRTPLTTIYGSSSAILENYKRLTDVQKTKMIQGIKEDSEWLVRMVENLLSITKINSDNVKIIKVSTVLDELIDSVMLKFKKRYPTQEVEITLPDDIVMIPMDAILIEQVLVNMLENAVQHAKGMTKLSLKVTESENTATFEIKDNGRGIEKARLEKIFTGYYDSTEQSSQTEKRNAGIGLSVCATIIKAHGGTIHAENANDGGAVFTFTLTTEESTYNEQ